MTLELIFPLQSKIDIILIKTFSLLFRLKGPLLFEGKPKKSGISND